MTNNKIKGKHCRRYSKISTEKREKLVQMVIDQGYTLTKSAKNLNIKRPTAKVIIKRYKETGTYFNKKVIPTKTSETENIQLHPTLPINSISLQQRSQNVINGSQNNENNTLNYNFQNQGMAQTGYYYFAYPPFFDYQSFF